jgi:hypothetical protein
MLYKVVLNTTTWFVYIVEGKPGLTTVENVESECVFGWEEEACRSGVGVAQAAFRNDSGRKANLLVFLIVST